MNIAQLVETAARRRPSGDAWRHEGRSATYDQLHDTVRRTAAGFARRGLAPGDRVALLTPNAPELIEALFAAQWAGLVPVPLNWHLHPREVRFIAEHSSARAFLVSAATHESADVLSDLDRPPLVFDIDRRVGESFADLAGDAAMAAADSDPTDPAWIFYTSGTTGRPKGATLTHRNLMAMTLAYLADVDSVREGSVFLHAAPLTHGSGLYLLPAVARQGVNVIAGGGSFDPTTYMDLIDEHAVTHATFLAPTMLRRVVAAARERGARPRTLTSLVVGGAPLYQTDLVEAEGALGPVITQIYGQGESPMTITVMPPNAPAAPRRAGSCGRAFTNVEVRVAGANDVDVPTGEPGEVLVRGDVVMAGYLDDESATEAALAGGWLHTGDVGHLDADGYLYLTDRKKDVVITGGSNVYPREVEEVLLMHPSVDAVAVAGIPDPEWGEAVCAFVVATPDAEVTEVELIDHCRAHLASFKKPRRVEFVTSLPTNAAGKVLKRELVAQATRNLEVMR